VYEIDLAQVMDDGDAMQAKPSPNPPPYLALSLSLILTVPAPPCPPARPLASPGAPAQLAVAAHAFQVSDAANSAATLAIYNGVIALDATASVTVTTAGAERTDAQVLNARPHPDIDIPHPYLYSTVLHLYPPRPQPPS
jgi:hypothetical protein